MATIQPPHSSPVTFCGVSFSTILHMARQVLTEAGNDLAQDFHLQGIHYDWFGGSFGGGDVYTSQGKPFQRGLS